MNILRKQIGDNIKNKLGILGGLGPLATAHFYQLLINMTDGHKDQDHLETVIYSKTGIPDRTNFLLGKSNDNPVFLMIEAAKQLEELSVSYIAIPCITAHYFYYEISSKLKTPLIDAVDETLLYLKEYGINTVGFILFGYII